MAEWLRLQTRNLKVSGSSPGELFVRRIRTPVSVRTPGARSLHNDRKPERRTTKRPQSPRPDSRPRGLPRTVPSGHEEDPGLEDAAVRVPHGRAERQRGRRASARAGMGSRGVRTEDPAIRTFTAVRTARTRSAHGRPAACGRRESPQRSVRTWRKTRRSTSDLRTSAPRTSGQGDKRAWAAA